VQIPLRSEVAVRPEEARPWIRTQQARYGLGALAVTLALVLVTGIVVGSQGGTVLTTGGEVASHTVSWVRDNGGRPISHLDCPGGDLKDGDSVTCQVAFTDGSGAAIKVTVGGTPGQVRFYEEVAP